MNLVDQLFHEVITPFLEPRIKKNSLKAVKAYVKTIQGLRATAISLFGLSAIAAVIVTGVLLMVIAVVGLLPIDPRSALIAMLVVGVLLTAAGSFLAYGAFKEDIWLEKTKAGDLIEAAMKPWETPYSIPDPRKIFGGESSSPSNRSASIERVPAPRSNDTIDQHLPPATYPSMTTPEAAIATRSIDTTSPLHH